MCSDPIATALHNRRGDGTASEWPELDLTLLEDGAEPAPPLPIEVFGNASGMIHDLARAASAPADYVAVSLLATVGATIANLRRAKVWGTWTEPPHIFVGVVGDPSTNKSPGTEAIIGPLRAAEAKLADGFDRAHRQWQTAKLLAETKEKIWRNEVEKAAASNVEPPERPADSIVPDEPKRPRIVSNDATVEALARMASEHPAGLLLYRDELAATIAGLDKYGGGRGADRAFFLEAFGGRRHVVDRVKFAGKELVIEHLSIGILGNIQPDRLADLILAGDDDGFAARFLFTWPKKARKDRPDVLPDEKKLVEAFAALRRLTPDIDPHGVTRPRIIPLNLAAQELIDCWRSKCADFEDEAFGLLRSHIGKWPGIAVRLATILEHIWWAFSDLRTDDGPLEISEAAAKAAIGFIDNYFRPMATRVYGAAASTPALRDAVVVARWIARQFHLRKLAFDGNRQCVLLLRDIQRGKAFGQRGKADRYRNAVSELVECGWLRPVSTTPNNGRGGRPSEPYELNPELRRHLVRPAS